MITRRAVLPLVLLLLVTAGAAACGGDGDDAGSPSEPDGAAETTGAPADGSDPADTTDPGDDSPTTESPTTESPTTEGGSTTSPNLPPNDSPLAELLLDPATVGAGYTPDDTLGDGSFDTDLCEEVTLDETWDDQAAQALTAGQEEDAVVFQQALLRFPDDALAEDFFAALAEALVTCQPGTEVADVDGIGDEAVLATAPDTETTAVAGLVRQGDLVGWHLGLSGPDVPSPVTEDVLAASAELLAA